MAQGRDRAETKGSKRQQRINDSKANDGNSIANERLEGTICLRSTIRSFEMRWIWQSEPVCPSTLNRNKHLKHGCAMHLEKMRVGSY